jgi:hypothetical protein
MQDVGGQDGTTALEMTLSHADFEEGQPYVE